MADMTRLSDNALRQLPWIWEVLGKPWRPYALALSLVAASIVALVLLGPHFPEPYLFLIPSILITGIVGGWGAGLLRFSFANLINADAAVAPFFVKLSPNSSALRSIFRLYIFKAGVMKNINNENINKSSGRLAIFENSLKPILSPNFLIRNPIVLERMNSSIKRMTVKIPINFHT